MGKVKIRRERRRCGNLAHRTLHSRGGSIDTSRIPSNDAFTAAQTSKIEVSLQMGVRLLLLFVLHIVFKKTFLHLALADFLAILVCVFLITLQHPFTRAAFANFMPLPISVVGVIFE